jgi:hypothetical protein
MDLDILFFVHLYRDNFTFLLLRLMYVIYINYRWSAIIFACYTLQETKLVFCRQNFRI